MKYTIRWTKDLAGNSIRRVGLNSCGNSCCKSEPTDLNYAYKRLADIIKGKPQIKGEVIEVQ